MKLLEDDKNLVLRALLENCGAVMDIAGEDDECGEIFDLLERVRRNGVLENISAIMNSCADVYLENDKDLSGLEGTKIGELCHKFLGTKETENSETSLFARMAEALTEIEEIKLGDVEKGIQTMDFLMLTYNEVDKIIRFYDGADNVLFMFDKESPVPRMFETLFEAIEG